MTFRSTTAVVRLMVSATLGVVCGVVPAAVAAPGGPPPGTMTRSPIIKADVIGKDQRIQIPRKLRKVAAGIGLLWQQGGGSVCTAFCVSDNIIATNAHCLVKQRGRPTRQLDRFQFLRAPLSSRFQHSQHLSRLVFATSDTPHLSFYAGYYRGPTTERTMVHDWAFAKLRKPVCRGHVLTFSDASRKAVAEASRKNRIAMIGYHGDRSLRQRWYSPNCRIRFRSSKLSMTHSCDSFKGSSGSPILMLTDSGTPAVIGINVGTVATRRYRVRRDRQTRRRVGRPRLLSTSVTNVAVSTAAYRQGLAVFERAKLLSGRSDLVEFQQRLGELGFSPGAADGRYGPRTRLATMRFERSLGRDAIGLPTGQLLTELRNRIEARRE
ncbi:MAG: trypsin-like peptidase domain-containing protein [Pseudomonadota bacterium]